MVSVCGESSFANVVNYIFYDVSGSGAEEWSDFDVLLLWYKCHVCSPLCLSLIHIYKNGGKIASPNAVSHLFVQCGYVEIRRADCAEEQVYDAFDELEGLDMEEDDESYILYVPFSQAGKIQQVLSSGGRQITPLTIDVIYKPLSPIEIDSSVMEKVEHLVDMLENSDDVQNVYTNVYTSVI